MHALFLKTAQRVVRFGFLVGLLLAYEQPTAMLAATSGSNSFASPESPVADPKAVVVQGHARFTVLTSRLIRMEWAGDGSFTDAPSLVFINRSLPVPLFRSKVVGEGKKRHLILRTADVSLSYWPELGEQGRFDATNLSVSLQMNGRTVDWRPGMDDSANLEGTTRTRDGALGGRTKDPMDPGLISRDGWVVVDDSRRPLFDSSDMASRNKLDSFAGLMQRSKDAGYIFSHASMGTRVPDSLTDLLQAGDRVGYQPETVDAGFANLSAKYDRALAEVKTISERKPNTDVVAEAAQKAHEASVAQAYYLPKNGR